MGGTLGRTEATGRGGVMILRALLAKSNNVSLRGASATKQSKAKRLPRSLRSLAMTKGGPPLQFRDSEMWAIILPRLQRKMDLT